MGVSGPRDAEPAPSNHHPFWAWSLWRDRGPGLFSVEKRPIAAIAYAVLSPPRRPRRGCATVAICFAGGGIAYTPIDDDAKGQALQQCSWGLFVLKNTFRVGTERRAIGRQRRFGHLRASGGLSFSVNPALQFFGLVSPAGHAAVEFHGRQATIPARHGKSSGS